MSTATLAISPADDALLRAQADDALLRAQEVADLYGVNVATVLNWAKTGKLKPVRVSARVIRFRRADLPDRAAS